jgi:hypothetical protein
LPLLDEPGATPPAFSDLLSEAAPRLETSGPSADMASESSPEIAPEIPSEAAAAASMESQA